MASKYLVANLVIGLALLAPAVSASAHAFPDHALPAVGSTVTQSPPEIRIWFSEKLEPAFSTVEVLDAAGSRVDKDDASVDARDSTVLRVSLQPLVAGKYKVVWHVVSTDTHTTTGDFSFTLAK
jgi:methionine-rich copper-binding protein CopC